MRHTLKTAKTMMPVALSTLVLVGAAPQVAIAAQNTQSTPVSNVGGYRDSDSSLPPVRETLTQKKLKIFQAVRPILIKLRRKLLFVLKTVRMRALFLIRLQIKKTIFMQ